MKNILFVFGTRPETVKVAPLIHELAKHPNKFKIDVCVTGQHRQMLDQFMKFFSLRSTYDLNLMMHDQTLFNISEKALNGLDGVLNNKYDLVFVQGDTTTAFIGALAAYYKRIKVAHLEAGLRSFDKYSPYPEEINRSLIGRIADYHFAPTDGSKKNLELENIKDNVFVVGNTVVDALFLCLDIIKNTGEQNYKEYFSFLDMSKKIILITGHRRESFGEPFEDLCNAIKDISTKFNDVEIVYPVHLNPNVRTPVNKILAGLRNVHLIEPIDYPYMIWLMNKCFMVLTDSGGVQEEAPSLGKPVLVMREVTERQEGITAGTAKLVGTDRERIVKETAKLLTDKNEYEKMAKAINPYGDGTSSKKICKILEDVL